MAFLPNQSPLFLTAHNLIALAVADVPALADFTYGNWEDITNNINQPNIFNNGGVNKYGRVWALTPIKSDTTIQNNDITKTYNIQLVVVVSSIDSSGNKELGVTTAQLCSRSESAADNLFCAIIGRAKTTTRHTISVVPTTATTTGRILATDATRAYSQFTVRITASAKLCYDINTQSPPFATATPSIPFGVVPDDRDIIKYL